MGRTRYREESQFNGTSPSAGRLVQRPNSIAWNSVTQAGHQQFNRPYSRGEESTPERHGAHSTRHFWDTDLPTPPSGVRPPPVRHSQSAALQPLPPQPGGLRETHARRTPAAAEHSGKCSLLVGAGGPPESYVPAEPGEVRTLSPPGSLSPPSHLSGHLALTLRSHALGFR